MKTTNDQLIQWLAVHKASLLVEGVSFEPPVFKVTIRSEKHGTIEMSVSGAEPLMTAADVLLDHLSGIDVAGPSRPERDIH